MRTTAILIVLGVLLTGCAKTYDVTGDQLVSMSENSALAEAECYQWLAARADQDAQAMSVLTKDQAFMFLVMRSNNDMVMSLMGKSANPCGEGTNVYDMMARVTESANQANAEMVGTGLNAVKWVGGIWAGGWALGNIVDKATGDAMSISGEGNTMTRTETNTAQIQAGGQSTGDNNLNNSRPEESEPEEEGGDYLGIPGCSGEESYLAGRCAEVPDEGE